MWLWAVEGSARLTPRVRRLLVNPAHQIWLSPISVLEMSTLIEKGRMRTDRGLQRWLAQARELVPTLEAPVTMAIAEEAASLPGAIHDPADRIIAATAITLDLTLVTADTALLNLKGINLLSGR
jgi:PIN domain nuclease of toxin-antitoxin system